MLDSLVRVSRRVLKVPKAIASQADDWICPGTPSPQPSGLGAGPGPCLRVCRRACDGPNASPEARDPTPFCIPSGESAGCRGSRHGRQAIRTVCPPGPEADAQRVATSYKGRSARVRDRSSANGATRSRPRRRAFAQRRSTETRLNLPLRPFGFLRFTPERFHVLLNSLFKVLFNFPSRYLFAIGLVVIFSLRWSLPPT